MHTKSPLVPLNLFLLPLHAVTPQRCLGRLKGPCAKGQFGPKGSSDRTPMITCLCSQWWRETYIDTGGKRALKKVKDRYQYHRHQTNSV